MKTFKYLSVACLSLGILASCSKDANQGPAPSNGEKHVVISMGGVQTKASDPVGLLSTTADVDNIAIFVTNTAGTILKKVEVDKNLTADGLGQTDHRRSADSQCRDGSHGPRRLRQLQKRC